MKKLNNTKIYNILPLLSLDNFIDNFNSFINSLKEEQLNYIYLLIKLNGTDDENHEITYSLYKRQAININEDNDITTFINLLNKKSNELNEYYLQIKLESIIFNYTILTKDEY